MPVHYYCYLLRPWLVPGALVFWFNFFHLPINAPIDWHSRLCIVIVLQRVRLGLAVGIEGAQIAQLRVRRGNLHIYWDVHCL